MIISALILDWIPPAECNVLTNPLCEVKLDTTNHQATFTWDSLHNVMQETDLFRTQCETDNMVREIDNMAEVRVGGGRTMMEI